MLKYIIVTTSTTYIRIHIYLHTYAHSLSGRGRVVFAFFCSGDNVVSTNTSIHYYYYTTSD